MRDRRRCLLSLGLAAVLVALLPSSVAGAPRDRVASMPGPALGASAGAAAFEPFRAGAVLVGLRQGLSDRAQRAIAADAGASVESTPAPGIRVLRVPVGAELSTVARLNRRPGGEVRFAEPDYLMREDAAPVIPNDSGFGLQWGSLNSGQKVNGTTGTPGADDRAASAWSVTTGGTGVVIAVADSGVDYNHPDLAGNVWTNPGGIGGCAAGTRGKNVITGSCDPMDDETQYGGHGTHVAGILGATGNNGTGVAGVNWRTSILPVKWLSSAGTGSTSDLIAALDWIRRVKQEGVNVRVVNDSATFVGTGYSQALADEIDVLGNNDILFVTAAGNTGGDNDDPALRRYPCGYDRPTEICVTASDQFDRKPSWANYGDSTVDLAAPGANIYSTLRNGAYGYVSGGSMASPQVAGAAALVLSRGYLPVADLRSAILDNVDKLPAFAGLVRTGGRLNLCAAIPGCAQEGTFGKTSVGGSSDTMSAGRKRVNAYSIPAPVSVSKLSIYLQPTTTAGQQVLRGVIYADQGGAPGALLATSTELSFASTQPAGWYPLAFPAPVTLPAGRYWIGALSGATGGVAKFRWDAVTGSRVFNANTYTSGPSDPFGPIGGTDSEQMSLYATYTT